MRRLLQIAALLFTAAAVIATSSIGEGQPSGRADFSFDLQTRDRAVYSIRLVNPPDTATLQLNLRSLVADAGSEPAAIFVAVGDRMPTAAEVDSARTSAPGQTQTGPLGRVLVNGDALVQPRNLSFEQGDAPHYFTLLRRGDAQLALFAQFSWSGEPYPGDLVIEDVTQELK